MLLCCGLVVAQDRKDVAAPAKKAERAWLDDLAKGTAEAVRQQKPILVRVGAEWCPWCKKLEQEISRPEVQAALGDWTLVLLDADRADEALRTLGIGPIPALRVLSPFGRVVASRDGYLTGKDLVAWLAENREKAADVPVEELSDAGPPSAVAVVRLARQLDQADARLREAALHRLQAYPGLAADPVVTAFAEGPLQRRLAAMELLSLWHAPVDGLDPWRPKTISADRIQALRDWAVTAAKAPAAPEAKLSAARLAEAGAEIDRLLAADTAAVPAIRERLARLGRDLLPAVYHRLKSVEADDSRERLTALRYRLVCSNRLAMKWPGGLERLAATSVTARHQAIDELTGLASIEDEGLWLELFSDPDPLVRETALRGLLALGGSGTSQALLGLLADPEPNVRAAVLKQLAEHPSPRLVPKLAEYVAKEADADLVAHAVRVLREIADPKAQAVLIDVLKHDNWSVRAEAVEGIAKQLENGSRMAVNGGASEAYADGVAALLGRLEDKDGFVIGRAVAGLKNVDSVAMVDPLVKVVETHPEFAAKAIESLIGAHYGKDQVKAKAMPLLRKFATHPRADVRAAVVSALHEGDLAPEVLAGLSDSESVVRMAAAGSVLARLEVLRHADPAGKSSGLPAVPGAGEEGATDKWLANIQEGKGRPKWLDSTVGPLSKMLAAPLPEERLAASMALIASGEPPEAVTVLLKVAKEHRDLIGRASAALPWRRWADRVEMFRALLSAQPGPDEFDDVITQFAQGGETRAADFLWEQVAKADATAEAASAVYTALRTAYFGNYYFNLSNVDKARLRLLATAAKPRAESGPEWQRLLALSLLASVAQSEAAEIARKIVDDANAPPGLRRDALRIFLAAGDGSEARKLALASLAAPDVASRKLALLFLVSDLEHLKKLRDWLDLQVEEPSDGMMPSRGDGPALPKLPRELTVETVAPTLSADDPEAVALAGYTLALLGNGEGLSPLLDYWRKHSAADESWDRKAYQAVSQAGDDSQVPVIEAIYNRFRASASDRYNDYSQYIPDLYWTMRGMDGPNARKLRQKIRREVGMPFLRGEAQFRGDL